MKTVTFVLPQHFDPADRTPYDRGAHQAHLMRLEEEEWHYRVAREFMAQPTLTSIDVTFSHEYDDQGGTYLSAYLDAQFSVDEEPDSWDVNDQLGCEVPRHLGHDEEQVTYTRETPEIAAWIAKLSK